MAEETSGPTRPRKPTDASERPATAGPTPPDRKADPTPVGTPSGPIPTKPAPATQAPAKEPGPAPPAADAAPPAAPVPSAASKPPAAKTEGKPAPADRPVAQPAQQGQPQAAAAAGAGKPAAPAKPAVAPPPPRPKTTTEDVTEFLAKFPGTQLEDTDPRIPTIMLTEPARLVDALRFLQSERGFEHLALITGVDQKTHLEVAYNLWSYSKNLPFEVKVRLDAKAPKVPSIASLWAGADWHERETYDLLGVVFEGHPDLRRILLPDGWQGHPLRKDYDLKKEQFVALDPVTGEDVVLAEPREGSW